MTQLGVDYSWDRPNPHCLASAGYRFVCRYISYDTTGKDFTASEAGAIHGAGLDLILNWEWGKYDAREGYALGGRQARDARAFAGNRGAPGNAVIYFSVDFDAQPHELPAVSEYFRACQAVVGANYVGVYGGYNTIDYLAKHGRAKWFWQTYAWSGGKIHPSAHLYQYSNGHIICGAKCDLNRALKPAFGAWAGAGSSSAVPLPSLGSDPTSSGFDYTSDMAGVASTIVNLGTNIATYSNAIDGLRNG